MFGFEPAKLTAIDLRSQFRSLHHALKRLLVSDIFIRTCEGMVDVFVVLYATNVIGVTAVQFGALVGIQTATSIAAYIPAARMPTATAANRSLSRRLLLFSFSTRDRPVAQLQGIDDRIRNRRTKGVGRTSSKSMIVDLADQTRRGRTVGLYYLTRSPSITPASVIGGLLWKVNPAIPFFVACAIGLIGTLIFVLTVERRYAS